MRLKTHPGVFLKDEVMKNQNLTNQYLYKNSSVSPCYWKLFLKGEVDIVEDIAYELSDKLNISADFWINMQNSHNKSRVGNG